MLDGKYINEKIRDCYDNNPIYPPLINVALGVKRKFKEFPSSASGSSFPLDKAATLAGKKLDRLEVQIYNFDPTMAPENKTVMRVNF